MGRTIPPALGTQTGFQGYSTHPSALVREVWTDPEHIKNWWGPVKTFKADEGLRQNVDKLNHYPESQLTIHKQLKTTTMAVAPINMVSTGCLIAQSNRSSRHG